MNDRVSARPNTYTMVTNADGTVTLTRADEPIVEGSLINKANMFPDTVCDYLGLPYTAEPKDGFIAANARIGDIVSSERKNFLNGAGDTYLPCDGRIVSKANYEDLCAAIGYGGQAWSNLSTPSVGCKGAVYSEPYYYLACTNGIYRKSSLDSSASWVESSGQAYFSIIKLDSGRIVGGSSYGIRYSDNGTTWTSVSIAGLTGNDQITWLFQLESGRLLLGANKGIWYSDNDGQTWTNCASGLYVYQIGVLGANLVAATGNGLYRSTNGGLTWTVWLCSGTAIYSFVTKNGNRWIFYGNYPYYSDDEGVTFLQGTKPVGVNGGFDKTVELENGRTVVGIGADGIYYSDSGITGWQPSNKLSVEITFLKQFGETLLSGTSSNVLRSLETNVLIPTIPNFYIKAKEIPI